MKKHFVTYMRELCNLYEDNRNPLPKILLGSIDFNDIRLNKQRLDYLNLPFEKLFKLKKLYCLYYFTFHLMNNDAINLVKADELLTEIEYGMQELWGFGKNRSWHKFWLRPHCLCPHVDNEERHPVGPYVYSSECPLHAKRFGLF